MSTHLALSLSVVTPQVVMEGAGVRLRRSIGGYELDHLDPFLLFDDFSSENPDDFVAGFPWHPHRGIETVTYILAGEVDHKDSIGNAGSIGAGDCQWMTAGGGIMHEEMPQARRKGPLAGFQLWVNLPARLKLCAPRYQNIAAAEVPTVEPAPGVRVRLVAGQAVGVAGPVRDIAAEPTYLDVSLAPGATFTQPVPRGQAAFVYVFEGSGVFGGDPAGAERAGRWSDHQRAAPGRLDRWGCLHRQGGRAGRALSAGLRRAAGRAHCPLWALRDEHAGGDRAGSAGSAGGDVRVREQERLGATGHAPARRGAGGKSRKSTEGEERGTPSGVVTTRGAGSGRPAGQARGRTGVRGPRRGRPASGRSRGSP